MMAAFVPSQLADLDICRTNPAGTIKVNYTKLMHDQHGDRAGTPCIMRGNSMI